MVGIPTAHIVIDIDTVPANEAVTCVSLCGHSDFVTGIELDDISGIVFPVFAKIIDVGLTGHIAGGDLAAGLSHGRIAVYAADPDLDLIRRTSHDRLNGNENLHR